MNVKKCRISKHLVFDTAGVRSYHPRPMSSSTLPRTADLRKLAAASARLSGVVGLSELPRLLPLLLESSGGAQVELELGQDDEGYRNITGSIAAHAVLQCQRCLGPVPLALDAVVSLAMVWSETEIPALPSRYDGLVVGQDPSDLRELVEEELLLALPLVAAHEPGTCPAGSGAEGPEPGMSQRNANPFAVLREGVRDSDS